MQTYEIIVSGRAVQANSADTTLVRTSIGIDKIHVLFDNIEWTNFPVRVTFANGETLVSTSLTLATIENSEWAAEAECTIPWEVIQDTGGIRITFQGTDSSGNHIITEASGTPLTVVEAGDVGEGTVPSPAPSVDEWNQAYADAMAAASAAASAAERINEIIGTLDADTMQELIDELEIALRYRGTVNAFELLPEDAIVGDTYNVTTAHDGHPAGMNYTWTGESWDALGGLMDLSNYATKDVATQLADGLMSKEDKAKLDMQPSTYGDGLSMDGDVLSLGPLTQSGDGSETHGCALFGVEAEGWATQEGEPSPDYPQEIVVARGRNLWDGVTESGDLTSNGAEHADSTRKRSLYVPVNGGETYSLTINGTFINYQVFFYDSSKSFISGSNISATAPFTAPPNAAFMRFYQVATTDFEHTQLELGSTPTPYVPYGHVGLEVRKVTADDGSILLSPHAQTKTLNGVTCAVDGYGLITLSGTATDVATFDFPMSAVVPNEACSLQIRNSIAISSGGAECGFKSGSVREYLNLYSANRRYSIPNSTWGEESTTFHLEVRNGYTVDGMTLRPTIELGTAEKSFDVDKFVETAPIPLPAKGWAGGLPDGTADALSVDSAGKWEWESVMDRYTIDGSSAAWSANAAGDYVTAIPGGMSKWGGWVRPKLANVCPSDKCSISADILFHANLASGLSDWQSKVAGKTIEIYTTLATPTTEHGYLDLPALPDGASVDIPELTNLGVEWWVKGAEAAVEHASNERKRIESELDEIREAIADL